MSSAQGITASTITNRYYYQQDALGTVYGLVDESGSVPWFTYGHVPWGDWSVGAGAVAANRLKWKGLFYESGNSQLYYVRARWYDPRTHRFLSEDPLGTSEGTNVFAFGSDDPVNLSDHSGMAASDSRGVCSIMLDRCPGALSSLDIYLLEFESWVGGGSKTLGPGVWLGTWQVKLVFGLPTFGGRHAALALVPKEGFQTIWELIGWVNGLIDDIAGRANPVYGGGNIDSYSWTRLGGPELIPSIESGIQAAINACQAGSAYEPLDSNRFIGDVLRFANIQLTDEQRAAVHLDKAFGFGTPRCLPGSQMGPYPRGAP